MSRFDIKNEDDNTSTEAMLSDLFIALSVLSTSSSARLFIADLLGIQEMTMIARRLRIAIMLMHGASFDEIVEDVVASRATVARMSRRLEAGGAGLKLVIDSASEKLKHSKEQEFFNGASHIFLTWIRAHPLYFWPTEMAIETIKKLNAAEKKDRKRIKPLLKEQS
jgi:TrpR-related protein YerC/YecD